MEKQEIKMSCNEGILFYNYLNEIEFNPSVDFNKILIDNPFLFHLCDIRLH